MAGLCTEFVKMLQRSTVMIINEGVDEGNRKQRNEGTDKEHLLQ
jgi:hypothetical protein